MHYSFFLSFIYCSFRFFPYSDNLHCNRIKRNPFASIFTKCFRKIIDFNFHIKNIITHSLKRCKKNKVERDLRSDGLIDLSYQFCIQKENRPLFKIVKKVARNWGKTKNMPRGAKL